MPRCLYLMLALVAAAPATAQSDPDPARFAGEIAAFEAWDLKNAPPEHPVLFVGSSSIRMWPTAHRFPDLAAVNRGFGGSHISDVLHYFDRVVAPYDPQVVVFYAGDNDVAGGKTAARVAADYETFTTRVLDRWPMTHVVFLPIKPSRARWELWPVMDETNRRIAQHSDSDPRLHYVDLAAPMLATGTPPSPTLFLEDGLHLSEAGYDLWTRELGALLDRLLPPE